MLLRKIYISKILPLLNKSEYGRRINIAFLAFMENLHSTDSGYAYDEKNHIFTQEEIEHIFKDLDRPSIENAKKFMRRQFTQPPNTFFIHPRHFFTPSEWSEYEKMKKDLKRSRKRYHFSANEAGAESLYYHHGLRFAPPYIHKNIAGKLICDIGGWLGDSTLVFRNYSPAEIIIFEPDETTRTLLLRKLKRNCVSDEEFTLYPFALSDKTEETMGMVCKTLDEISKDFTAPIGLLKADIEGMGLRFLLGARETILKNRPMLSLSIYHCEEEFIGIYQTLKSWNINYHFEIKQYSPLQVHGEYTLLAYPEEWIE